MYLANQLDDFKQKMKAMESSLPDKYYDTRSATEKNIKGDTRILNIENYRRYKAFQSTSGILDFSGMTNNVYQSPRYVQSRSYWIFWLSQRLQ